MSSSRYEVQPAEVIRLAAELKEVARAFADLVDWCEAQQLTGRSSPSYLRAIVVGGLTRVVAEMVGDFRDGQRKYDRLADKVLEGALRYGRDDEANAGLVGGVRHQPDRVATIGRPAS